MCLAVNTKISIVIVDTPKFQDFLEMANSQIIPLLSKIPAITKIILCKFHLAHLGMISHVKKFNYISVSCYSWSLSSHSSMLGITAHCINKDFYRLVSL